MVINHRQEGNGRFRAAQQRPAIGAARPDETQNLPHLPDGQVPLQDIVVKVTNLTGLARCYSLTGNWPASGRALRLADISRSTDVA